MSFPFWAEVREQGAAIARSRLNFMSAKVDEVSSGDLKNWLSLEYRMRSKELFALESLLEDSVFRGWIYSDTAIMGNRLKAFPGGFGVFREIWESARQLIILQARLYLEQQFWNLGDPWRGLVTGFKPIQ